MAAIQPHKIINESPETVPLYFSSEGPESKERTLRVPIMSTAKFMNSLGAGTPVSNSQSVPIVSREDTPFSAPQIIKDNKMVNSQEERMGHTLPSLPLPNDKDYYSQVNTMGNGGLGLEVKEDCEADKANGDGGESPMVQNNRLVYTSSPPMRGGHRNSPEQVNTCGLIVQDNQSSDSPVFQSFQHLLNQDLGKSPFSLSLSQFRQGQARVPSQQVRSILKVRSTVSSPGKSSPQKKVTFSKNMVIICFKP